jgi:DHHC palmitoyltransferase
MPVRCSVFFDNFVVNVGLTTLCSSHWMLASFMKTVGYFNYRYFVNFLIFTFVGMLYGALLMLEPFLLLKSHEYRTQNALLQQELALQRIQGVVLSQAARHELQPRIQPMMPYRDEKVYLTLSFMLCVAVGVALIGLGGFHIYLVSTGQTTIEFHGNWALRRRYEQIVATVTPPNGTKKKNQWQNPYSRGTILANWQQVYGVSTASFLKRIGCGSSDRSYINLLLCILIPHRRLPEYLPVPIPGQSTLRSANSTTATTKLSNHIESDNCEVGSDSRYLDDGDLV